ncbi:hypothetical protein KFE25_011347 [Diacronema lutheri]|uniref:Amino acid transporter transmembrane domain-containing protein n=1 Tax=Diacronema lutheri TaxID=2081491 RepID=A0A8J5XBN8_DIALT|nr:hypothetical protein KFE25_011347 [Diacronema lutheri]
MATPLIAPPTAWRHGHASLLSSVANLCNTIVGAGILGLPYALARCGLLLGVGLLLGCALGCALSLHLLARSAHTTGVRPASFYSVANAAIPRWAFVIDLAVAVKCFGVATSYLIVAGDMLPLVCAHLRLHPAFSSRELWVVLASTVAAPLACASRLDVMKYTSALAIACVVYLAVLALATLAWPSLACAHARGASDCRGPVRLRPDDGALRVLSIFVFGFTCQQNVFSVVNELRKPTLARIDLVVGASVLLALALYLPVGVGGYLTYGSHVAPDVLLSYPPDSPWVTAARAALAVVVVLSYPLQAHPSRRCFLTLLRSARRGGGGGVRALGALGALDIDAEAVPVATLVADAHTAAADGDVGAPTLAGATCARDRAAHAVAAAAAAPARADEGGEGGEGERIERPADGRCARRLLIGSDEQRSDAIGSDAIGSDAIGSDAIGSDAIGRGATTAAAASPLAASTVQLQPIVLSGLGFPESGGAYSAYTAAFLAGSLLIALAVDDLGVVMAVVGATGSTAVSYILPGAIYWVLHPHPHAMRFAAGAMFAAGVCITPVSLAAILTSHGDS